MRKRIWIPCVIALVVGLLLLLLKSAQHQKTALPEKGNVLTNQPESQPNQQKVLKQEQPQDARISYPVEPHHRPTLTEISNLQQQALAEWQKPIEFYGKVVDERTNPVAGASIKFQWADRTENVTANTSLTESDTEGLFSLHGKKGRSLEVWVSKEGYYASHEGYKGFLYSLGNDIYSPNPQNPVIFKLQKKGQGAELITSENGMRSDVWVRVPKDNTPVRIDFFQKQASATGQLEIRQVKPPWQTATNWSFSLSIPDGGLVENHDDFQFEASESGYQPVVGYDFTKGGTNWTTQVTKQFYIVFGQPRKYGWLRFESDISQETVFVTYAINPTGSRNLEPQ